MNGCDVMDDMLGDHNPYTKFNLGWITSSKLVVTNGALTLNLGAFAKNGDTVLLANNWDENLGAYQEYYVIIYYTMTNLNAGDAGYFARDGIVVYHINASLFVDEVVATARETIDIGITTTYSVIVTIVHIVLIDRDSHGVANNASVVPRTIERDTSLVKNAAHDGGLC